MCLKCREVTRTHAHIYTLMSKYYPSVFISKQIYQSFIPMRTHVNLKMSKRIIIFGSNNVTKKNIIKCRAQCKQ